MLNRNETHIPITATDKTSRAFASAKGNMRELSAEGAKVSRALKVIGIGFGAGLAASAALMATSSVSAAAQFEKAAREVNSLLNLDESGFDELTRDIQRASLAMGTDLIDTTRAAYQAISAGVPRENLLEFLTTSAQAAIAGLATTETSVDVLSTVVNSFGRDTITASRAADILFAAVKDGKTTFSELAASLSQAAPLAAAMGVDFEELAAAAAAITKRGAPTAEAMTQIRAIMVALKKPTADMQKIFEQLGVANGDALVEARGFKGALDTLTKSAKDNGMEITKVFSQTEALNGVLNLTGKNAEGFGASLANAYGSAGAAADAFAQNNDTAIRAVEKLKSAWQNFGAQLMRTEEWGIAVGFLTQQINRLADALNLGGNEMKVAIDADELQSVMHNIKMLKEELRWEQDPAEREVLQQSIDELEDYSRELTKEMQEIKRARDEAIAPPAAAGQSILPAGTVAATKADVDELLAYMETLPTYGPTPEDMLSDMESDAIEKMRSQQNALQMDVMNGNEMMLHSMKQASDGMSDAFVEFALTGKSSFSDMASSVLSDISRMIIQMAVLNPLMNGIMGSFGGASAGAGSFGGARAAGGPVAAGSTYLVGEKGPELFRAPRGGEIIPNSRLGQGESTVAVSVTINTIDSASFSGRLNEHKRQITAAVDEALNKRGRRGVTQ